METKAKKAIYVIGTIALLSAMMVMPAVATTWDVYEGDSIQAALNNASDGDTVFVHAGTYLIPLDADPLRPFGLIIGCENCILKGEGADVVTLDGNGQPAIVVGDGSIPYSGCIVEGFKIINASTGVAILESPNCIVRDNVFEAIESSAFGTFALNTTFMGNVINGGPYLKPNELAQSITFMDNVISNTTSNWYAVRFRGTSSIVANNTLINNAGGLGLYDTDATDITVTRNTIRSGGAGIKLYKTGSGNKIYLNDIVDNTESVKISSTTASQFWNSTEPIEYTYNGSTYTNYLGNYWDVHSDGESAECPGIWDTPYSIPSSTDNDYRPLMAGFENYHVKAPAPPTPLTPQTPFLISGEVSYEDGTPVLNPVVTVKKTGENFTVNTSASSNLYLTLTDSMRMSVGDEIIVNASDGTVYNETEHNVTEEDMYEGGFEQDMLLEAGEKPDLTVTEKSEELLGDGTFNVTYTVANIGTMNADTSTTSIRIDGGEVATDSVPALAAGENYTNTVGSFDCPCGTNVTVMVCADNGKVIEESNETNNCLENEFECPPCKPDLTVTAISTPARLRADAINPISAVIENIGSEDATSFDVTFEADGTVVDTVAVASLNVSESTTVEFLWTPTATGNCTLNVTADANEEVGESNETNNSLTMDVTVLPKLTVTANVRIEGNNDTVWTGDVTFSNSTIKTTDGVAHYLNEPTALGALDEADKLGGFGYVLVDYGWGLYVSEIAGEPPIGWDGWMYRVDYTSPWVGSADYTLYGGEDILWYFGAWTAPPLMIELDKTVVNVNESFIATVTGYNDTAAMFESVENATVYADGLTFQTGADGNATLSIDTAGNYTVYADKGTWKEYTRSEKKVVTFLSAESYGDSVYYEKNVRPAWRALGEPDSRGAILFRNAEIAIKLEQTIPACKNVSVWVRKIGFRPASFDVAVSSDGENWTTIGSETCNSRRWTRYDFSGEWGDVKYIGILKPGTPREPRIMALDAIHAEN